MTFNRLAALIFIFMLELTTISHRISNIIAWCSSNVLHCKISLLVKQWIANKKFTLFVKLQTKGSGQRQRSQQSTLLAEVPSQPLELTDFSSTLLSFHAYLELQGHLPREEVGHTWWPVFWLQPSLESNLIFKKQLDMNHDIKQYANLRI